MSPAIWKQHLSVRMKVTLLLVICSLHRTWPSRNLQNLPAEVQEDGPNPYLDFKPPSLDDERSTIKLTMDSIERQNFSDAHRTLSPMLKRYSCFYTMKQLYRMGRNAFTKLLQFCQLADSDTSSLCLLRGLAEAISHSRDISDTVKVTEIAKALVKSINKSNSIQKKSSKDLIGYTMRHSPVSSSWEKVKIYNSSENPDIFQTFASLRKLQLHASNEGKVVIGKIMDDYRTSLKNVTEAIETIIYHIRNREYNNILYFSLVTALTADIGRIFQQAYNTSGQNVLLILDFVKHCPAVEELSYFLTTALFRYILIPFKIGTQKSSLYVFKMLERKDVQLPEMPQDMRNETRQLIKQWITLIEPSSYMTSYLDDIGFNLNASDVTQDIAYDISHLKYKTAKVKLFKRLFDVEYFSIVPKVLEKLNLEKTNNFDRLVTFLYALDSQEYEFVVIRALVMQWVDNQHLNISRILKLEKIVNLPEHSLPSVIGALGVRFDKSINIEFDRYFTHNNYGAIKNFFEWFPAKFKTYFWLFLLDMKPNTDLILEGIERFYHPLGSFLMYTSIVERNIGGYDLLRLVFGLKIVIEKHKLMLAREELNGIRQSLPLSARNLLTQRQVCLLNKKQNLYLGINRSAEPYDTYRREVALYSRQTQNVALKWIITKPSLNDNVYLIQNSEYEEYLIYSVFEFDQERRRLFTWIPKKLSWNAHWRLELGSKGVTIQSVRWDEYMYGGRRRNSEQGVVYTWKNLDEKLTGTINKVPNTKPQRIPDVWIVQQC